MAMAASDEVILDVHEYYEKQTPRNRYAILGVNGPQTLTIPVEGQKGQKVMTKDIRIAHQDWRKPQLTAIRSAYGRSSYFEHYYQELQHIFEGKQDFLIDFNWQVLEWLKGNKHRITDRVTQTFVPFDQKEVFELSSTDCQKSYLQVFSDRMAFVNGLSAIDWMMNLGPRAPEYVLLWKNGK